MSALSEAAASYAARGWAVLPLGTRNKVPAIKGGCRSATSDETQVHAWWSANPGHNIGIATGAASGGLVVIDIDVDPDSGEDGMAELRRWERRHGSLPETVTAITGRGGLHLYYRTSEPFRNSANRGLGIDVRGDGGFVVAPPSVHPNGNAYAWEAGPDVRGVFEKIVTGKWTYTDVKNGDGFEFKPYCTLVFSCNEFPSLGDSSEGMLRRLFPIPFDAHFSKADEDYDPRLWDKLRSEDAARYLIRVGVEGLRRVRERNGLTPNARSEQLVGEVRSENDSLLQWIEDAGVSPAELDGRVIALCYEEYEQWCRDANLRPYGKSKFTRKVNAAYGYASVPEKRTYSTGIRSVRVFRPAKGAR